MTKKLYNGEATIALNFMKKVIAYNDSKESKKLAELLGKFLNHKGPKSELVEVFREIIKVRNLLSINLGFKNQLDLNLNKRYQVPKVVFEKYRNSSKIFFEEHSLFKKIRDVDMCGLTFSGLSSTADKNTTIHRGDYDHASYKYNDQKGVIDIFIPKDVHENQAITMLIHELGHAKAIIGNKIALTQFEAEKSAYDYEFNFLKSKSQDLFLADLDQYKSCFWRTDFEIEAYTNPDQDLFVLSGNNDKYLNDEKLIMKPFIDLPHALAIFDLLF